MKLKHLVFLAFLLSFVFLAGHVATAQEYASKKLAVKLGFVKTNDKDETLSDTSGKAFGFKDTVDITGGISVGVQYTLFSKPKSDITIGIAWARPSIEVTIKDDLNGDTDFDDTVAGTKETRSGGKTNITWWHIPLSYVFKFSKKEDDSAFYLGLGPSYFSRSGNFTGRDGFGNPVNRGGSGSAFGFHINAGWDSEKFGLEAEYSTGKKSGFDLGGIGLYGVYKF